MEPYRNLAGDSGVVSFECGPDFIKVGFRNGSIYVYDYAHTGEQHVERMKELARNGRGLSTYISRFVQASYSYKER